MSPALALMMVLLQAAPAPPAPSPPAIPEPAAPVAPQAEPAPAEPAPFAPALPTTPEEPPPPPRWSLGVTVGVANRLSPAAHDVPPALGIAFSTSAGLRYATLGRLELGVRLGFSYQRYARTVHLTRMVAPGEEVPYDGERQLSTGEFGALQTFTFVLGRVRPWAGAGGGLALGHFTSLEPKYAPGESRPTLAQVQAAAGFHLEVAPQTDGSLQVDYAHPFASTITTTAGDHFHVFGDRLAVRLGMQYRF